MWILCGSYVEKIGEPFAVKDKNVDKHINKIALANFKKNGI